MPKGSHILTMVIVAGAVVFAYDKFGKKAS